MADARTAVLITLDPRHEGGFQKNPNDRRNWSSGQIGVGTLIGTNGGITPQDMPGADIEHLTTDQKVAFYLANYWKPLYSEINSQLLANKIFDMGVLFGIKEAVEDAQNALLSAITPPPMLHVDGIFGPETLLLTNEASPVLLMVKYQAKLVVRAHGAVAAHPEDAPFFDGWQTRIYS